MSKGERKWTAKQQGSFRRATESHRPSTHLLSPGDVGTSGGPLGADRLHTGKGCRLCFALLCS